MSSEQKSSTSKRCFAASAKSALKPLRSPFFALASSVYSFTTSQTLVLMLRNERKEKRVLLIYGIYTQGSQAAIEYLTNPERMAELRKQLIDLAPDHKTIPSSFQVLLTTTVENAVPDVRDCTPWSILMRSMKRDVKKKAPPRPRPRIKDHSFSAQRNRMSRVPPPRSCG